MATIILIGTAGLWYDGFADELKSQEFEALLDKLVSVINGIYNSQTYTIMNITHDQSKNSGNSIYIEPLFNNEPYEIIITNNHAVFQQDDLRCSREFISTIQLIDSKSFIENRNIYPAEIILEAELDSVNVLKLKSYDELTIVKIILVSEGILEDNVIILCS